MGGGTTLNVTPEFAASVHPTAFDDCWLTPEEMATSPTAMAFAAAFRATTAAALGVDPSAIVLDGISTDGDQIPGCAGALVNSTAALSVSDEFAHALGNASAFQDCYLSAEEIASDPTAREFATGFAAVTAANLGIPVEQVLIGGMHTDGDHVIGCCTRGDAADAEHCDAGDGVTCNDVCISGQCTSVGPDTGGDCGGGETGR